jgi:hypothetical protein
VELSRHELESSGQRLASGGQCFGFVLACLARIGASRHEGAGFITSLAGIGQWHLGVRAQPDPLLLALEPVLQPPPLPAVRLQFQVQPATVGQLAGFVAGLGLADRGIGQGVGGRHLEQLGGRFKRRFLGFLGQQKSPRALILKGFLGFAWPVGAYFGAGDGNRTHV